MEGRELIIVRSLTDSDMGLFAEHRRAARSKQRAIALTTPAAKQLIDPALFASGGAELDFICMFGPEIIRESRPVSKVGKNWRLGGRQIVGRPFAALDSKDFALIRSVHHNDGSSPVIMTFVGRHSQRFMQAGLVASLKDALKQSVAIFQDDDRVFQELAELFPPVPARVAVRRPESHTHATGAAFSSIQ